MKSNIVFIADEFASKGYTGGAEFNDAILIRHLKKRSNVSICSSSDFSTDLLNKDNIFIVGNFVNLPVKYLYLLRYEKYIIYEHDHKYVKTRDPSKFIDFEIPKQYIINREFYRRAHTVVVLSKICEEVIVKNLQIHNVHNIGTSLWTPDRLKKIRKLSESEKTIEHAVLRSLNPTKGYAPALAYCKKKGIIPTEIGASDELEFLEQLSKCKKLIFIPQVLETFNRLTAEAKMLNCKLITRKKLLGFASESCFDLTGPPLIEEIKYRVQEALLKFEALIEEIEEQRDKPTIAFIGKFEKIYDEEGKALALENLGLRVIRYNETAFNRNQYETTRQLLAKSPDVIIYTKLRVPESENLIVQAKEQGIKTACWVPDLYFGLDRESELTSLAPIFTSDYVFTPDGGNDERFTQLGINHICIRQAISKSYLSHNRENKRDIDILFVGTLGPEHGQRRKLLLEFLQDQYPDQFMWIGESGPESLRGEELAKVYHNTKVVIGDCVPSDSYWSNRVYETLGRGSFLLHPAVPGIEKEFIDKEHLALFERDNFEDLKEKIDFYLDNDSIRNTIANNGYLEVSQKHTLQDRAKQILEILK